MRHAQQPRTVIIGAGIVGCSVADHLTRLGGHDVTVVDQGPLFATGGSTSHAPGLVFQTNPSQTMTQFAAYSVRRYGELGHSGRPCFRPVGSIEVARTPERWKDLHRKHGLATSWGVASRLLAPEQVAELVPLLDPARIHGGFHVPSDGIAKAVWAAEAMAEPELEPWDVAALDVIVKEAGGRLSHFDGGPFRRRGSCLTTNSLLHDEVLRELSGP